MLALVPMVKLPERLDLRVLAWEKRRVDHTCECLRPVWPGKFQFRLPPLNHLPYLSDSHLLKRLILGLLSSWRNRFEMRELLPLDELHLLPHRLGHFRCDPSSPLHVRHLQRLSPEQRRHAAFRLLLKSDVYPLELPVDVLSHLPGCDRAGWKLMLPVRRTWHQLPLA